MKKILGLQAPMEHTPIVVLAHAYDTFNLRCKKSSVRIVCCTPALYVWLVSHVFHHESRPVCPLQGHRMCVEKGRTNWEELLAGMIGASVSWFPQWKEGGAEVLCLCGEFPNVPLMGTRGCINYNPILAIRQLGYLMRGHNRKRSSCFLLHGVAMKAMQKYFREFARCGIWKKEKIRSLGEVTTCHRWLS